MHEEYNWIPKHPNSTQKKHAHHPYHTGANTNPLGTACMHIHGNAVITCLTGKVQMIPDKRNLLLGWLFGMCNKDIVLNHGMRVTVCTR